MIPEGAHRISFDDDTVNIPLIAYRGPEPEQFVRVLLDNVQRLCSAWHRDERKVQLTFSFGIPVDETLRCYSLAASASAMLSWLASPSAEHLPESLEDHEWA